MKSLKNSFILFFIFVLFFISILSWNHSYISKQIVSLNEELVGIKELQVKLLEMRRAEKDFFLRKDDKYKEKLLNIYKLNKDNFSNVKLGAFLETYIKNFLQISDKMKEIGYSQDEGLKKIFRDYVHTLEDEFKKYKNDSFLVKVLQLRRYEKDFLLRLDIKYVKRHQAIISDLEGSINLDNYNNIFLKLVENMKVIGLDQNSGLRLKMRDSAHDIENKLNDYIQTATPAVEEKINHLTNKQQVLYFIFIFFLLSSLILFLKPINKAFFLFKTFFTDF